MRYTECRCTQQIAWGAEQRAERGGRCSWQSEQIQFIKGRSLQMPELVGTTTVNPAQQAAGSWGTENGSGADLFFLPLPIQGTPQPHLFFLQHSSSSLTQRSLTPLHAFLSSYCTVRWIVRLSGCHGKHHHVHLELQVHLYHTISCIPPFSSHLTVHFGLRRMDDG